MGTSVQFDSETETFVRQLHNIWRSNAPEYAYEDVRDQLMSQRDHVDTQITTLSAVASLVRQPAGHVATDWKWDQFFDMARAIEKEADDAEDAVDDAEDPSSTLGKRKRSHRQKFRLRNLAIISALWSPDLVQYYGWNSAAQGQIWKLRVCAVRYPHFATEFSPRLNAILLKRHCEAIRSHRGKTLNEARLQPHRDLNLQELECALLDSVREFSWLNNADGAVEVDEEGTLLRDLRPSHYELYLLQKDAYGLLMPRRGWQQAESGHIVRSSSGTPELDAGVARISCEPTSAGSTPPATTTHSKTPSTIALTPLTSSEINLAFGADEISQSCSPALRPHSVSTCDDLGAHEANTVHVTTWPTGDDRYSGSGGDALHRRSGKAANAHVVTVSDVNEMTQFPDIPELPSALNAGADMEQFDVFDYFTMPITPDPTPAGLGSHLHISDVVIEGTQAVTIEECLHKKYQTKILALIEELSQANEATREDMTDSQNSWMTPTTRWANIWTSARGSLPRGRALSESDAEVLYFDSTEFLEDARGGRLFDKPVVIRETFTDSDMHNIQDFDKLIRDTISAGVAHVETSADGWQTVTTVSNLEGSLSFNTGLPCSAPGILNLGGLSQAHKPLMTMLKRFRLLEGLLMGNQMYPRKQKPSTALPGIPSSTNFKLLSLAGAFSRPRADVLAGAWLRNLRGSVLCVLLPESSVIDKWQDLWQEFMMQGRSWNPAGRERLIVLEQDDVLFIPPGSRLIHATYALTAFLVEGGKLWDDLSVLETLRTIYWACKDRVIVDAAIPLQLPDLLTKLDAIVHGQVDRFRGIQPPSEFLMQYEQVTATLNTLGCSCIGVCNNTCPCRLQGQRCTAWCFGHPLLPERSCLHTNDSVDGTDDEIDSDSD